MSTVLPQATRSGESARPSVIRLNIKEKAALYAAYISSFKDGGLFLATDKDYRLGDDVYVLVTLPNDTQRYPIAGKVAWITPAKAPGNRTQGIGVQFPADENSKILKQRIELIVGAYIGSGRPTLTL